MPPRAKVRLAITPAERARGLLGVGSPRDGDIPGEPWILIAPCRSIHTFGMQVAIDLAFMDAGGLVVSSERAVPPGRLRWHPRARAALERISGPDAPWPISGDRLDFNIEVKERR